MSYARACSPRKGAEPKLAQRFPQTRATTYVSSFDSLAKMGVERAESPSRVQGSALGRRLRLFLRGDFVPFFAIELTDPPNNSRVEASPLFTRSNISY